MIVGTLHYMAPEQVEGKPADARTDLWALGVILYEMLTGKRAFQGGSAASLITAIMGSEPASLTTAEPLTPPGVDRLVRRCLAKDPDERWQSAHDVAAELRWMHERIGVSVGAAPVRSRWRVSRRSGWVATGVGGAAIAAALVAWLLVRQTPPIQPTAASLTSYSGSETQPSFSPDGQKLAFVWDGENGDNQDIYVKQIGSPGLPMRLTSSPVAESQPAWSPDDRWIAFARSQPSQQNVAVFLIPPLGGPERKLTEADGVGGLSWTPDAKWLVLSERDALRRLSIWAIHADTGERRQLTRFEGTAKDTSAGGLGDTWPLVSPDGRALAFARQERTYVNDLYMLPLGHDLRPAGEPVRVTRRHYASMSGIAWTANSREVVYAAGGNRVLNLWRVSVFGQGAPTRLAFALPSAVWPAIASKTSRLIYAWQIYNANLWRLELPSGERKLLVGSTYDTRIPQYSRDGTKIAFQSDRSGNWEVWSCDADGSDCLQLTSFNGPQCGTPRWSPDGRWIALDSRAEGWPEVYVIAADGGMPRRVTNAPGFNNTRPSWSADGRWLYFTSDRSGRPEIWKVPAGGGQEVQVTRAGGAAALCSPDGKFIYYLKEPFPSRLFRMPADGGDEQVVTQAAAAGWADFDVTAKGVYFLTAVDAKRTLHFLDMTTGRVAALADLPSITGGLCVSPDDRFVAWSQLDRNTIDLMLVENFR
jgi:Tol biopolymer transport system component